MKLLQNEILPTIRWLKLCFFFFNFLHNAKTKLWSYHILLFGIISWKIPVTSRAYSNNVLIKLLLMLPCWYGVLSLRENLRTQSNCTFGYPVCGLKKIICIVVFFTHELHPWIFSSGAAKGKANVWLIQVWHQMVFNMAVVMIH